MDDLFLEIRNCKVCENRLPLGAKPIFRTHPNSKILIIGQAPGLNVHKTEIPWNDPSGNELRRWLSVDKDIFYNTEYFSIVPMGFCYPGKGKNGDLPPSPECAPLWHEVLTNSLKDIELTLLVGSYSINYYLKPSKKQTLTECVKNFRNYFPKLFPLVHPSPRNRIWHKRNPWFETDVLPVLQEKISDSIKKHS